MTPPPTPLAVPDLNPLIALYNARRYTELESQVRTVLTIHPNVAFAWQLLGGALQMQGKDALAAFQKVAELTPKDSQAHFNLGVAYKSVGQFEQAASSYRRAVATQLGYVAALSNLGSVLQDLDQLDEAVQCYQQALVIQPNSADTHNSLGTALKDLGQLNEAVICYRQAIQLQPNYADAHYNLANALKALGQLDEAVQSYKAAIRLQPNHALAHSNLGSVFKELGQVSLALQCYQQAIAIDPRFAGAHNNLGSTLRDFGRIDETLKCFQKALEIEPDYFDAHSSLLFSLNYTNSTPAEYLAEALGYGKMVASKVSTLFTTWRCNPKPQRLRVGIVSGDLRTHSVAHFLESLLPHLDVTRIELIAYSTQPKEDDLTLRIKPYFSLWRQLYDLNDQAAAQLIHDDGVHVLLDISGHTAHNRLPVFAWKPAPVQCTWLGLPTTTGVAEMDYILGDPIATPAKDAVHFSEKIWQLPEIYLCLAAPDNIAPISTRPTIKAGWFTFGSFNNFAKINEATIALWARILAAKAFSRLFLKTKQLKDPVVLETVLQRFAVYGITKEQLILEGTTPHRSDHLATYQRVDIALDTFPYPGVTTSAEALWMGVPVLTMQGDRFMSRTAASILHNAGLSDWIASNEDDYVAKAVQFASELPQLAILHAGLREQVRASPLFDAPRFAKHFEQALWGMWQAKGKADV